VDEAARGADAADAMVELRRAVLEARAAQRAELRIRDRLDHLRVTIIARPESHP